MDEQIEHLFRNANFGTKKFQTPEHGRVIRSDRTFGIELEIVNSDTDKIEEAIDLIPGEFGFEHDGSVKGDNPSEIVSPVLRGRKGEEVVSQVSKILTDHDFDVNDTCGFHVHLGAEGFLGEDRYEIVKLKGNKDIATADNLSLQITLYPGVLSHFMDDRGYSTEDIIDWWNDAREEGEYPKSKFGVAQEVLRNGDMLVVSPKGDRASICLIPKKILNRYEKLQSLPDEKITPIRRQWLNYFPLLDANPTHEIRKYTGKHLSNMKTLLYLYTVCDDLFLSMLPTLRREGNEFCEKMTYSYSPRSIELTSSWEDFEKMWYKTSSIRDVIARKRGTKYDESRYFGVNLHALFQHGKSIEIRYHAGTIDSSKILYWVALHQTILDKIVSQEITIPDLTEGYHLFNLDDKIEYFLQVLELPEYLDTYVRNRISTFK